ncbi:hypothetical protein AGMMS50230_10280 [Spirochaetia bacterium]|nr:hypothetical protein AGMMS50230_10280 [Spirochaetia bacterium]
MRIPGASALPNIGYALTSSGSGRMSLPVSPSSYIYSHFKHVSGVPAPEGTRGVAITKLKVLDVLIEQLGQMKKQPAFNRDDAVSLSSGEIDALIEKYEGQIKAARAVNTVMPYAPAPQAPAGALFSLVA